MEKIIKTKPLYHITARSLPKDKFVDLEFTSIEEAQFHNQHLTDFSYKGLAKEKKKSITHV